MLGWSKKRKFIFLKMSLIDPKQRSQDKFIHKKSTNTILKISAILENSFEKFLGIS
jgi:hypothetical protein